MDYIEAYSKCDDGREVVGQVKKFVTKTYLSHRKFTLSSAEISLFERFCTHFSRFKIRSTVLTWRNRINTCCQVLID
ncbi:hypothetical protein EDC96DRAFT_536626 [Choanephora cucurbitarum]|nr:hypothetical protein EDC96DRAFT_536626 [Choanephora cucurbitarum]